MLLLDHMFSFHGFMIPTNVPDSICCRFRSRAYSLILLPTGKSSQPHHILYYHMLGSQKSLVLSILTWWFGRRKNGPDGPYTQMTAHGRKWKGLYILNPVSSRRVKWGRKRVFFTTRKVKKTPWRFLSSFIQSWDLKKDSILCIVTVMIQN